MIQVELKTDNDCINTVYLPGIGIPIIKLRWSWDRHCLRFVMGIPKPDKTASLYWDGTQQLNRQNGKELFMHGFVVFKAVINTKLRSYLAVIGGLWGVYCEYFEINWLRYDGIIAVYLETVTHHWSSPANKVRWTYETNMFNVAFNVQA